MRHVPVIALAALLALSAAAPAARAADAVYRAGYQWNRQALFVPGPKDEGVEGNPQADDRGSLVITYAAVMAAPYGEADHSLAGKPADRWYRLPRATMEYKKRLEHWRHSAATIDVKALRHSLRIKSNDYTNVPVVIWTNPAGNGARVRIDGVYTLKWTDETDADLVVAYHDVSSDQWTELSPTARYARPNDRDSLRLTVDPVEQDVDLNDEIIISVRAARALDRDQEFITLEDKVTFTLVPRPLPKAARAATPPSTATSTTTPTAMPVISRKIESDQFNPTTMTIVLVIAGAIINGAFLVLFNRWRKGRKVRGLE